MSAAKRLNFAVLLPRRNTICPFYPFPSNPPSEFASLTRLPLQLDLTYVVRGSPARKELLCLEALVPLSFLNV